MMLLTAETDGRARADEIDHRPGAAAGRGLDLRHSVRGAAVDRLARAGLHGSVALAGIDIDDDDFLGAHLPGERHAHQADAARADNHQRLVLECGGNLFQRAERRDAGAGEGGGLLGFEIANVKQVARVRREHMGRITALGEHADILRLEAEVFVAALAHLALAAAHPRIDEAHVTDLDTVGVRAERHHLADVFVPHGERQLDAAVGEHQLLAAPDLVIAVPDVQVGVAHPGREHLQQHLRALGLRGLALVHLQRRAAFAHLKTTHVHSCFPPDIAIAGRAAVTPAARVVPTIHALPVGHL